MNNDLDLMNARLRNVNQQDRMVIDKRKTLDKAILYSYQGAKVKKLGDNITAPALINPSTVKQDYDDKIISIGFEYNYTPGTIFEWINGTKWLIYLQDLTELAYFRGDIRKCNYKIAWKNKNGELKSTYVALRGPKETNIDSSIVNNISIDSPNHTLYLMMPKNEDTVEYFTRYSQFYLQNSKICWRVESIDDISMPGILEVNAVEYYSNKDADDIERGLVDDKLIIPEDHSEIMGPTFIKPKRIYKYSVPTEIEGSWGWDKHLPITAEIDGNTISLTWTKTYTDQFELSFGENIKKTIIIESLF